MVGRGREAGVCFRWCGDDVGGGDVDGGGGGRGVGIDDGMLVRRSRWAYR